MMNNRKNVNILNVESKVYSECGFCKNGKERNKLIIPWHIWAEWLHISHQFSGKEWGCIFWTEITGEKEDTITKYLIPEQEISTTEIEFKEELGGTGIMHSHHSIGGFHSSQDNKYCRNLTTISVVYSTSGVIASKRVKLPCGGFGYLDMEISISGNIPDVSKIKDKPITVYPTPYERFINERNWTMDNDDDNEIKELDPEKDLQFIDDPEELQERHRREVENYYGENWEY